MKTIVQHPGLSLGSAEDARRQYKNLAEEALHKYGLAQTLEMIAQACWEKAEHIRANWQDKESAEFWDQASSVISKASTEIEILSGR